MDACQGSGHWARLLLTTVAAWFAHDTALADEHDMAVREFLLEFASQSRCQRMPVNAAMSQQETGRHTVVGSC